MVNKPVYLYVTPFFPSPATWRGAVGYDFVAALQRTGHYQVYVLKEGDGSAYELNGIRVHTFPARRLPSNVLPFLFQHQNNKSFLRAIENMGVAIRDVAVCHANTANYAPYALAVKRVNPACYTMLQHHDLQSFGLNNGVLRSCWLYNMLMFPWLRHYHEQIDCHVFISEASRRSFLQCPDASWTCYEPYKRQMRGLPYRSSNVNRSLVMHNGVDVELFQPAKTRVTGSKEFVIGTIANFGDLKDYPCVVEALAIIKDKLGSWKWKIVGTGPTMPLVKRLAEAQGISGNIEYLAERSHEDLPAFYQSLDIFVLPSYFEGFGCVFTEAYASGVPFISCEGQGIEDLMPFDERKKWLIKPHDHVRMAEIILWYFNTREQQRLEGLISTESIVSEYVETLEKEREAR